MPIISSSLFQDLADRVAKGAELMATAFTQAQAVGGGSFYPRIHQGVTAAGNYDVENALIDSANDLDDNTLSGTAFPDFYSDMINAHEAHVIAEGASSLDAFLNTSGINCDPYYEEVYFLAKGSHLLGRNVYSDVEQLMGVVDVVSSGVATFTDGAALGTGAGVTSPTNRAAAHINAIPQNDITADLVLDVRLYEEAQTTGQQAASRNVTITSGVLADAEVSVGELTDMFLDITDIVIAGGTLNDTINFISDVQRVRAL